MSVRFPGSAEPAVVPIAWEAWTRPTGMVRFDGEASPATVALDWEAWTHPPTRTPATAPETPPPAPSPAAAPTRAAAPPTVPSPTRPPSTAARTPSTTAPPPTELLGALAHAQQATAEAHATYLRLQSAHLDALDDVQQALARVLERQLG